MTNLVQSPVLLLLLLAALALRVWLWLTCPMVSMPDMGTCLQVTRDLVSGDFSAVQWRRTSWYTLLGLLDQSGSRALAFLQAAGLATAGLLGWMSKVLIGQSIWGLSWAWRVR